MGRILHCAALAAFALAGCQSSGPIVGYVQTTGAATIRLDARWILIGADGAWSAGAHYKSLGEPLPVVEPQGSDTGGWWIVDMTGEEDALELPLPPEPWPAWVRALGLIPDPAAAELGIEWEVAP